jgi:hypothetical protein
LAQGRTASTYCNKGEWDAWQEEFGELVEAFDDGFEVRQHATLKAIARGGSRKVIHNCVIAGNPAAYARWKADDRLIDKGWYPEWTYYPLRELAEVRQDAASGTRLRPVSGKCLEGKVYDLP